MKKIKSILIATLMFQIQFLVAQEVNVNWSDKQNYKSGEDGYFSKFIGANDQTVYALYTNNPTDGKVDHVKVIALDKITLQKKSTAAIIGFPENTTTKAIYSKLTFFKVAIQKDGVYIFWTKIEKESEELYVEKLDINLKRTNELTKIIRNVISSEFKRSIIAKNISAFVVLENNNDLVIGYEVPKFNEFTKFKYGKYSFDKGFTDEKEVNLPIKLEKQYTGINSIYDRLKDGNVVIKNYETDPNQSGISLVNGGIGFGVSNKNNLYSFLNISNNKISTIKTNQKDKYIEELKYIVTDDKVKFYGLFCDTKTNPKKDKFNGFVHIEIDKNTVEFSNIEFINFTTKVLTDLNYSIGLLKLEDVTYSNKEIFMSISPYMSSVSPGNVSGTYIEKGNILELKIDDEGSILWHTIIPRTKKYYTTFINYDDVKVISYNNSIVLFYSSSTASNLKLKQNYSGEQNNITYSIIDSKTGQSKTIEKYLDGNEESMEKLIYMPNAKIIDSIIYTDFTDIIHDNRKEGYLGSIMLK